MEAAFNTHGTTPSAGAQQTSGDTGRQVREWATRYWNEYRWCVVPAHVPFTTRDERLACSCKMQEKCDKPGKHPIGLWGEIEYATAKDRWFDPAIPWLVNISLLTGRRSGVVVADVDPRHGGKLETLWALGWSPDTVAARTGGGGWHVLALCPPEGLPSVDAYAPGIEFKADGKQVIIPPSLHPSWRHYRWVKDHGPWDRAVAPLPPAVIEAVRASRTDRAHSEPVVLSEEQLRQLAKRVPGLVARAVERARSGEDGGRHNTGVWLACQLRDRRVTDEMGRWAMQAYQQELEAPHVF